MSDSSNPPKVFAKPPAPGVPAEFSLGGFDLRRFRASDAAALVETRSHPEIVPWLPPIDPSLSAEQVTLDMIERFEAAWEKDGYGPYAVVHRQSGRLIGHHGIRYLEEFEATEILYTLHPDFQGQGVATMLGRRFVSMVLNDLAQPCVMAITLEINKPSRRVMEKLGLRFLRMAQFRDMPVVYYQKDRA